MVTFSVLLALCEGNSSDTSGFPTQRPVTRNFGGGFSLMCARTNGLTTVELPMIWNAIMSMWHQCNEMFAFVITYYYMMTSSNENTFRVTGPLLRGESTGHRWIPTQRPVTRSLDIFFYLRLNKQLSNQSWGWWFETSSRSTWRHCNESGKSEGDKIKTAKMTVYDLSWHRQIPFYKNSCLVVACCRHVRLCRR